MTIPARQYQHEAQASESKRLRKRTHSLALRAGIRASYLMFGTFLLLATLGLQPLLADQAEEDAAIEEYLSQLRINDILAVHLEETLERTPAKDSLAVAKKLVDIYAAQLSDTSVKEADRKLVSVRVDDLVKRFPKANTPRLQGMLLEAEFRRGEKLITDWFNDRKNSQLKASAQKILASVSPKIEALNEQLQAEIDALHKKEVEEQDNKKLDKLAGEIRTLSAISNMNAYNLAWSNYYWGLCETGAKRTAALNTARDAFRDLVGILKSETYDSLKPETVGLESAYISRSMLGLSQTEVALGNVAAGRRCYELVATQVTPPAIRDLAPSLFLLGLINAERFTDAEKFAASQLETFTGSASQGKANFCLVLIFAGFKAAEPTATTKSLGRLGVEGAARLQLFPLLSRYVASGDITIDEDSGFYLQWIAGQQQFQKAEETKSKEGYTQAAATLELALKRPDARTDLASRALCRYMLGNSYYRLNQFEKAVNQYELVTPALKNVNDKIALEAATQACAASYKLAKSDERFVDTAVAAFERIKRDFPESKLASESDRYIADLKKKSLDPLESIASWEKIEPTDTKYSTALYEIARLRSKIWREAGKTEKPKRKGEAIKAITKYLTEATKAAPTEKIAVLMFAAEIYDRSGDAESFQATINQAAKLESDFGVTGGSVPQLHAYQLNIAKKAGDADAIDKHANYLAEKGAGTPYELSGLIYLAQQADKQLAAATDANRKDRLEKAKGVYQRIVRVLGQSPEQVGSNKNARTANSKLAALEFDSGDYEAAANRLEVLLQAYPKNTAYLRRTGIAQFKAKNYQAALPHFRTLLNGLPPTSEGWYEAKYHQLAILARTDLETARKVYEQFVVLHPKIPFPALTERFAALKNEIGS